MNDSEKFTEIVKRNLVRLHAHNILLQQDSEQSTRFYSLFSKWTPSQKDTPNFKQNEIYRLCNILYHKLGENKKVKEYQNLIKYMKRQMEVERKAEEDGN